MFLSRMYDSFANTLKKLFTPVEYKQSTEHTVPLTEINNYVGLDSTASMNRQENIRFYDTMDEESPECSVALNFIADLATQGDDILMQGHKTIIDSEKDEVEIESKKKNKDDSFVYNIKFMDASKKNDAEKIEKIIKKFELRTKIKFKLRNMLRRALKYGDNFEEIIMGLTQDNEKRIIGFKNLPIAHMVINTDSSGRLDENKPYSLVNDENKSVIDFKPYEVFRLQIGGEEEHTYGKGLFNCARKTYMRIDAMEAGMVIGRLVRSHLRYKFLVDVQGMSPDAALTYVQKVKNVYTKKKVTDINGNLKYIKAPLGADEDIFYPKKKDSPADVSILQGDGYLSNIDDVKHFYSKLLMALYLPKSVYETNGSRNALAEQDTNPIRFVKSVQNNLRCQLLDLYAMELKLHGIDDDTIEDMYIEMPEIDSVSTVRKFDIERVRAEICSIHSQAGVVSKHYILENILLMTEAEIAENAAYIAKEPKPEVKPTTPPQEEPNTPKTNMQYKKKKLGKSGNSYTTTKQAE